MTASSPSAAARRSTPARSSPSWPARRRPMWDFEDVGDWWTRADPNGIAPVVAVPTTAGTGSEVGRAGVITQEATHTKKIIFHPADDAEGHDLRSRADRRHAAAHHRRHRPRRARPLPRGLLRARLPPDGRRHRRRGHAAREGVPAARLSGRRRPRGAGAHDVGRRDGRDRLPEGPRRHPRPVASGRARSTTPITG